jgi:surface antigen
MMRLFLVLCLIFTFGCATNQQTPYNRIGGGLLGGIAGGIAGNQIGDGSGRTAAIIGGTILGVGLGSYIGSYMDRQDMQRSNHALETSQTNQSVQWHNPDTNNQYNITPTRTFQSNNTYCREYIQEAIINNEFQTIYGTACRQPDGTWKITNEQRI